MPNAKLKPQTNQQKLHFTKKWLLWGFVGLVMLIVAIVSVRWVIDVQQEQQRFSKMHKIQLVFQANVRQTLGSSLAGMKEYDSCYRLGQAEMSFPPFPNGKLYCGMEIEGALNVTSDPLGKNAWAVSQQVAKIAIDAIRQSGLPSSKSIFSGDHGPNPTGKVSLDYSYTLYINGENVGCDIDTDNDFNAVSTHSVVDVQPNQIYFTLNCRQPTSKNFFRYVP